MRLWDYYSTCHRVDKANGELRMVKEANVCILLTDILIGQCFYWSRGHHPHGLADENRQDSCWMWIWELWGVGIESYHVKILLKSKPEEAFEEEHIQLKWKSEPSPECLFLVVKFQLCLQVSFLSQNIQWLTGQIHSANCLLSSCISRTSRLILSKSFSGKSTTRKIVLLFSLHVCALPALFQRDEWSTWWLGAQSCSEWIQY